MSNDARRIQFDSEGYVIIRELLPSADLALLQQNLDRYIREVVPRLSDADAFYDDRSRPETLKQLQHMEHDPFFADYADHPVWNGVAEQLLGETVRGQGTEWFNKPAGTNHPTPPHQDNYYFCLTPPQVLTIWLALDPVDEENGCLRYVPGSHLRGVRPHGRTQTLGFSQGITDYGPEDYAHEVPIILQPGDAVIHHGNTIHRADANRSAVRNRRSFAIVFRGESCRRDEPAYSRYREAAQSQHAALGLKT